MAGRDFCPIADTISIHYICPQCGHINETGDLEVPIPNFEAESHSGSIESEIYEDNCEHCGHLVNFIVSAGIGGGDVYSDDLDEDQLLKIDESITYEDDQAFDRELFELTHDDVSKLLEEIEPLPNETKEKLYKLLYAKVITNMETYLGDTLKRYVLNNEQFLRTFVEKYEPYNDEHILLSNLFTIKDKIQSIVGDSLSKLMYHNLPQIKPIYKDVLNIDCGNIQDLCKAIQIRHDIVHRNGADKSGNVHVITKEMVATLSRKVTDFIYNIDNQLPTDASVGVTEPTEPIGSAEMELGGICLCTQKTSCN